VRVAKGQNNRSGDRPLQQSKPRCRASRTNSSGPPRIGGKPGATRREGGHHVSSPNVSQQDQDESERRLASEGQPYKSTLRGDGEDAEGAAGAVDDFEGGGDDHGAGGGQLIEIAKAGEAKLSASVHEVVV